MKWLRQLVPASEPLVIVTALLLCFQGIATAQQVAMGSYYAGGGVPLAIAAGPDGALWFTEYDAYSSSSQATIGRVTTAGTVSTYAIPAIDAPNWITAGPDGALWFTEYLANSIGRISTSGAITTYAVAFGSDPLGITTGPDGALWFTEYDKIGRMTTDGTYTEYPVPSAPGFSLGLFSITAGPDGAMWFTEAYNGYIGRITMGGTVTEYQVYYQPQYITAGPDGALWFTETIFGNNYIGRMTTGGVLTQYRVNSSGNIFAIAAGPDGALWFTIQKGSNMIGRITTDGVVTLYAVPQSAVPQGITTGPDGQIWFAEYLAGQYNPNTAEIGELVLETANLAVSPTQGRPLTTTLTFTGSGFGANETVNVYTSGVGSKVLVSATTDASGSFTASAYAPQSPHYPRLFLGVGQTSGRLGAANFNVTPGLILKPNSGPPGTQATLYGFGYNPSQSVQLYWDSATTALGAATVNSYGTFTYVFTVPATASTGVHNAGTVHPGYYVHFTVR